MRIPTVEEWVFALRSGYYRKIEGMLLGIDGSGCALGVLCHLADHAVAKPYDQNKENHAKDYMFTDKLLKRMFGKRIKNSDIFRLNDGGMSFEKIANFIESVHKQNQPQPKEARHGAECAV